MRGSTVLGLVALVGLTACDSLFGPDDVPPAGLQRAALPSSATVAEALDVRVTVRDKDGNPLKGEDVHWSPAGGGTVSQSTSSSDGDGVGRTTWTLGTTAGQQTLRATVRELETTFTVTARPAALAELTVTPGSGTMTSLGDSLTLVAAGVDAYGNTTPLTTLAWSSSAPQVAEVTAAGVVVSHSEGEAEITASMAGVRQSAAIMVDQVVAGIGIEAWTTVLARSESFPLTPRAVDARGAPVDTALSVTWTSSDEGVVSVSGGVMEAVEVGSAVVTATASPFRGELAVEVKAGPRPTVTTISPAVLAAGATATITGTGFSPTREQNQVTVAGVPATVDAATATELVVTMPGPGSFPCGPTGAQRVRVVVTDLAVEADHAVAGASQLDLAVGEAVTLDRAALACNEVVAAGSYVLTVFNTAAIPTAATAFRVQGSGGATATAPLSAWTYQPSLLVDPARPSPDAVDPETRAHLRMLERNQSLLERLGPPSRAAVQPRLQVSAARAVGELRTFRVPDLDQDNLCTDYQAVTARAVYAGAKGVIWEDTLAPLAGTMDDTWRAMGAEFDDTMYPVLLEYFGDPLTFDSQLDGDGRFNMLFSKFVNDMEAGVAGFVFSGDFYPRTSTTGAACRSSDEGEIFYGRVPTAAGTGFDGFTPTHWLWSMRSTVIHEVKHIASYAHKFRDAAGGSPNYEEQWLEESTARLAEEFYARTLFGYGQGDNVRYDQSIYCEIHVNDAACSGQPAIMIKHFGSVNDYMKSIESLSPIGKVGSNDWSFYGSGWLFVRWAIDQSGASEADFVRALVDEDNVTGVANIEARTGRSFRELLADFSLALAVDDHPDGFTAGDPSHSHPGWDTREIFARLHDDYADSGSADRYDRPWPLRTRALPPGSFSVSVPSLQGGSTTVFTLQLDPGQRQLLQVLGDGGGDAPSVLGMALVRVQ